MIGGRQCCLHFQPTDRPTVSPWKILTVHKHSYNLMKLTWGALLYKVMNPHSVLHQEPQSVRAMWCPHSHSAGLMVRGQEDRMEKCSEFWDNCVISHLAEPVIRRINYQLNTLQRTSLGICYKGICPALSTWEGKNMESIKQM